MTILGLRTEYWVHYLLLFDLVLGKIQNCVFLCSLDNFLLKTVIVFIFGKQLPKWRSFEKGAIFDLIFTFSSRQGKDTKIRHICYLHKYTF